MNKRKVVLLLVAFMIAMGTVVVARGILSGNKAEPTADVKPTKEILVAATDIPAGSLLKEADMKWQPWPAEEGATNYLLKGKNEPKELVGTVARYGIRVGEPLTLTRVVRPGEQGFMAAALSPGLRAVSISITPVAGVAGFVFPGDRVDVIVAHNIGRKSEGETTPRRVSETILTNIRVLALDQRMNDQASEPKIAQIATLEVSPKQAETLALVSELGTLSLALRSIANDSEQQAQTDGKAAAPAPATTADGQTIPEAAAIAVEAPASPGREVTWDSDISQVLPQPANRKGATQKIQIIRGKDTTEAVFDLPQ